MLDGKGREQATVFFVSNLARRRADDTAFSVSKVSIFLASWGRGAARGYVVAEGTECNAVHVADFPPRRRETLLSGICGNEVASLST